MAAEGLDHAGVGALEGFEMLTPGANSASGERRAARKTRAASIAARKYPIPATASTVVRNLNNR